MPNVFNFINDVVKKLFTFYSGYNDQTVFRAIFFKTLDTFWM